ncbi:hypothetical protein EDC04DRAFT_3140612 [Pisolithus marmoratus]|nr:hypothetical protein EDC04DRAFT_3140612 [Pisolithus marmoratus]
MPRIKQTARKSTGGKAPRKQLAAGKTPEPSFDHIFSQTQQNIEHLIAHSQISQDDGADILAKLGAGSPTSSTSAHIISQTQLNIGLLIAHNQIPEDDGRDILAKLSCAGSPSSTSMAALTREASQLSISSGEPDTTGIVAVALMGRTSEGPGDLNLRPGDVIEIIEEIDAHLWIGRNQAGEEGFFPSIYVKKFGCPSDDEF